MTPRRITCSASPPRRRKLHILRFILRMKLTHSVAPPLQTATAMLGWLINQTRKANGVSELPVSEALMNAAQVCSDRRYTWHHTKEECEAVIASGYPHGFGTNLTVFTGVAAKDTAQHALENWISSSGHFETMIEPDCDGIGVGVTESGGVTYCYMFVGRPNTQNPYE